MEELIFTNWLKGNGGRMDQRLEDIEGAISALCGHFNIKIVRTDNTKHENEEVIVKEA